MNNKITFFFNGKDFQVKGSIETSQLLKIMTFCLMEYLKAHGCKRKIIDAVNGLIAKTEADAVMEVLFDEGDEDDEELD